MAKNINIVIQFPTLRGQDEKTRNAEIEAWKAACQWAHSQFPDSVTQGATPCRKGEKQCGEWERKVNAHGKRLRLSPRLLSQYGSREAYARYLIDYIY